MKKNILILIFCLAVFFSPKIFAADNAENSFKTVIDLFKSILDSSKTEPTKNNPVTNPNITDINQLLSGDGVSETSMLFMGSVASCIQNRQIYEIASTSSGVPWQVLAGIHFREGGCNSNTSLASGRAIGEMEPDITTDCSSDDPNSLLIPIGGGCGFRNVTDSAVWSARHLMGKIGRVPGNFADLARGVSYYNGGGNANCGKQTPYQYCPSSFTGDDDPYAMNMFDDKHKIMYLIYCEDGVPNTNGCPRVDGNPGVMTAIQLISFATK